jgi:Endo-beta-mannanase
MRTRYLAVAILVASIVLPVAAQRRVPKDLSSVRGFNYQAAEVAGHADMWAQYNPAVTERDLDYAKRLQLNQIRVFVPYAAWEHDKDALKRDLQHFVRAAHARGMGVMPTMQYKFGEEGDKTKWENARPFVTDLVAAVGKEPGLEMWDVENEPDCCKLPPSPMNMIRMEHAVYMAKMFHEVDPVTPVTIGMAYADNLAITGDAVDVISFHNYLTTRADIRADIAKAKAYAAKMNKPLINSEIGCIARANPYDVVLQEHMDAHIGWYIWELMITGQWGTVHGVFYPDGTVRDPSIVAALLGMFRNRGDKVIEDVPDRENHLTEAVANNKKWLADANADWNAGLDLAEVSVNLLEASQLIAMHDLPSRKVMLMRKGAPDMQALRAMLEQYTKLMEPYQLAPNDPRRGKSMPPPPSTPAVPKN